MSVEMERLSPEASAMFTWLEGFLKSQSVIYSSKDCQKSKGVNLDDHEKMMKEIDEEKADIISKKTQVDQKIVKYDSIVKNIKPETKEKATKLKKQIHRIVEECNEIGMEMDTINGFEDFIRAGLQIDTNTFKCGHGKNLLPEKGVSECFYLTCESELEVKSNPEKEDKHLET